MKMTSEQKCLCYLTHRYCYMLHLYKICQLLGEGNVSEGTSILRLKKTGGTESQSLGQVIRAHRAWSSGAKSLAV